jgi:H+/gluconate symporter-like permease
MLWCAAASGSAGVSAATLQTTAAAGAISMHRVFVPGLPTVLVAASQSLTAQHEIIAPCETHCAGNCIDASFQAQCPASTAPPH